MTKKEFILTLNNWGAENKPFFFIVDFEFEKTIVLPLSEVDPAKIKFSINGVSNVASSSSEATSSISELKPIAFQEYREKFNAVYRHLSYGDSYLTNLTVPTEISLDSSLENIFFHADAKYKVCVADDFVMFSPECFVRIVDDHIFTYPMKGTIDASVIDAEKIILGDTKELAEHVTIVDLLRNDLSQISENVTVTRFRYIDKIKTRQKTLLQVSSEIRGTLPSDYKSRLGEIFERLLPAGSVSGAPKPKTIQIIHEAEKEKRGYYTGVFGYFDGTRLDSGVMIRFIEKRNNKFFYRSGGGITTQSSVEKEYQEIIDKVYVPIA